MKDDGTFTEQLDRSTRELSRWQEIAARAKERGKLTQAEARELLTEIERDKEGATACKTKGEPVAGREPQRAALAAGAVMMPAVAARITPCGARHVHLDPATVMW